MTEKKFELLSTENKTKIRGAHRHGQKFVTLGDGNKYTINLQIRNVTFMVGKQAHKQTEKWLIVRREKEIVPVASIALDPNENMRSGK